jgi:hypothetical protein
VTQRKKLLLGTWAGAALVVAAASHFLSPLKNYDTGFYFVAYYAIVTTLYVALSITLALLLGRERLRLALRIMTAALRWPRPTGSPALNGVTVFAAVAAALGTIPHYSYVTRSGSGGSPPFSSIEVAVLTVVFRPVLPYVTTAETIWRGFILIAIFWAAIGAVIGLTAAPFLRHAGLSWFGLVALALCAVRLLLWALVTVFPLYMPF